MLDSGTRRWEYAGNVLYTREVEDRPGVELYAKNGMATTVQQMLNHDGPLIHGGEFVYVSDRSDSDVPDIVAVHPWMGVRERFTPDRGGIEADKLRPLRGTSV